MSAEAPWPVMEVAIEPKSNADQEKLEAALRRLVAEDPTFRVTIDQESGQTLLQGMGELHLDSKVRLLMHTYKVDANVGQPQIAYRETLGRAARVRHTHKRRIDGAGEFADLTVEFVPSEAGEGYSFESRITSTLPEEYVAGIEKGLASSRQNGLLAGFPVVDFKAILVDASYHELDSSASAFEIAAREAFRQLRDTAHPRLLEPAMRVEVTTPEDFVGDVIGDLNSRKGFIVGTDQRDDAEVIIAMVPLSNMFGYVNVLRSMSQGRASFHMEFDHYAPVPHVFDPDPDPDLFPPAAAMRA